MSVRNIEDVYPLSPLQEGLLFHSLYGPEEGIYVAQLSCRTRDVDVSAIQRAWQKIIDRYPPFRTAFIWKNVEKPLQVVQRNVTLPFRVEDWRGLSSSERQERLDAYLAADRQRGFQLNKAPLLRLALFRLDDNYHQLVLSNHHIIVDGWSLALVFKEAFALYEAYCEGREPQLASSRPYREYIAWLSRQDLQEAEEFWRRMLEDFSVPTSILREEVGSLPRREVGYSEQQLELSAETTAGLLSLGRLHHLTMNTIVLGAWAMLLSRHSGQRDVLFGVVMSGRPPDLAGVESMVGLFVNTLPMRIAIRAGDLLSSWLEDIQTQQLEIQKYEYSPLANVQQWSDLPRGEALFESLFTFENFPATPNVRLRDVEVSIDTSFEKTSYPLTVMVGPGTQLIVRLLYDDLRIDHSTVKLLLSHFQSLLENMAAGFDRPLSEVEILAPVESELLLDHFNADLEEASI